MTTPSSPVVRVGPKEIVECVPTYTIKVDSVLPADPEAPSRAGARFYQRRNLRNLGATSPWTRTHHAPCGREIVARPERSELPSRLARTFWAAGADPISTSMGPVVRQPEGASL